MTAFAPTASTPTGALPKPVTTEQPDMSFTPSTARTITVQADSAAFAAGPFWKMDNPKQPLGLKDPNSTTDYTFDWAPWLTDAGASIDSFSFELGTGLVKAGEDRTGAKVTIFVSGGTPGAKLPVTCRIKTLDTPFRIEDRTVYLLIEDR